MLLSLDVGFRHTGWALFNKKTIKKVGIINTVKTTRKDVLTSNDDINCAKEIYIALHLIMFENDVQGIIGEAPVGGGQNSAAVKSMGIATGILGCLVAVWDLPDEWCTPQRLKKRMTGRNSASKEEIMDAICKHYQWEGRMKQGRSIMYRTPLGDFKKGDFEHIADAIGTYLTLESSNLVKMYG